MPISGIAHSFMTKRIYILLALLFSLLHAAPSTAAPGAIPATKPGAMPTALGGRVATATKPGAMPTALGRHVAPAKTPGVPDKTPGAMPPALGGYAVPATAADIKFPEPTPAMKSFSRICYALLFISPIWQFTLLWLILSTRLSSKMRDRAEALSKRSFLTLFWYLVLYTAVAVICKLPLNLYAGYWLEHHYGLSHQPFAGWAGDYGKSILVDFAIRLPVFWVIYQLMTRWPKRWEFRFWLVLVPLIAIGIFAQPLIVEPLFNKFTPLPPSPLHDRIHALAVKAGIPNAPILVADMSKQTDETNAYVDGIGSSARIVMWDTTLKKMPDDQIVAVIGHEMGHYVLKHVYWGFLGAVVALFFLLPIIRRLYDALIKRNGARWGIDGPNDIAGIPALLFVYIAVSFLCNPIVNATAREIEHEADVYGLQVTGNRIAMAQAFVALSKDNLSEPSPPPFIQFWFYNHPTLQERVDYALGKGK